MDPLTGIGLAAAGVLGTKPLQTTLCKMFENIVGPVTKEWGEGWAQWVRDRRQDRAGRTAVRAGELVELSERPAIAVSSKVLISILDACSKEDDDEMSERWAKLLASAAVGADIPPFYPRCLEELTPVDARLLDECIRAYEGRYHGCPQADVFGTGHAQQEDLMRSVQNLERLNLVNLDMTGGTWLQEGYIQVLPKPTYLGADFVAKCRGPLKVVGSE